MKQPVLTDTGTGEVDVIVFLVNNNRYCINVLKAREIIQLQEVRSSTDANKSILGITSVRDQIMTIIDLSYILDKEVTKEPEGKLALICEFNTAQVMFTVDHIEGIERVKWSDIVKPDPFLKGSLSVGNILTDKGILLMLDFEKIITDLNEQDNPYEKCKSEVTLKAERSSKKIYIADDSKTVRGLLEEVLVAAGYDNLHTFDNGQEVLEALMQLKEEKSRDFKEEVDLLITDIEMPFLDGHTVTRRIKEDEVLSALPVVIFSSLITDDLYHKGCTVGADNQISKPSIHELIDAVDALVF